MYLWTKLPEPSQSKSIKFCQQLVLRTGVAVSPRVGVGKRGEGYVIFALVHNTDVLEVAVKQIAELSGKTL